MIYESPWCDTPEDGDAFLFGSDFNTLLGDAVLKEKSDKIQAADDATKSDLQMMLAQLHKGSRVRIVSVSQGDHVVWMHPESKGKLKDKWPEHSGSVIPQEETVQLYVPNPGTYTAHVGDRSAIKGLAARSKVRSGVLDSFDLTLLMFAFLNSAHKDQLLGGAEFDDFRTHLSKQIRPLRNNCYGHVERASLEFSQLRDIMIQLHAMSVKIDELAPELHASEQMCERIHAVLQTVGGSEGYVHLSARVEDLCRNLVSEGDEAEERMVTRLEAFRCQARDRSIAIHVTNLARRIYNEARETGSSDFAETQLDLWKRELQDDDWFSWIAVPPEVLKMILCRANLDSAYSQEGGTMRVGISMS